MQEKLEGWSHSVATGRVFHARQTKSEGTKQKAIPWPSRLEVGQGG